MSMNIDLKLGECITVMSDIPDSSVDMVLCEPSVRINYVCMGRYHSVPQVVERVRTYCERQRRYRLDGDTTFFISASDVKSFMVPSRVDMGERRQRWIPAG